MGGLFTRERFGRPQVLAGLLLLVFLGQCAWLVHRSASLTPQEKARITEGFQRWNEKGDPQSSSEPLESDNPRETMERGDPNHSQLWYLIAASPLLLWPEQMRLHSDHSIVWLARAPYMLFGVLLGASLWYVSRRLYGNAGGYVALGLYCFSPAILRSSAVWFAEPEVGATWGAFGTIFTAIAVAHTLYAPREVILWNWRRIVLLGVSLALAVGSQFSLIVVIPIALAGLVSFPFGAVDSDMYVLALPMEGNAPLLSVGVFVGGLSAATAMVIVECVALSIMVSNDIVVPLVLQRRPQSPAGRSDFGWRGSYPESRFTPCFTTYRATSVSANH